MPSPAPVSSSEVEEKREVHLGRWALPNVILRPARWFADSFAAEALLLLIASVTSVLASKYPSDILAFNSARTHGFHPWVTAFWILLALGLVILGLKRIAVRDARVERLEERQAMSAMQSTLQKVTESQESIVSRVVPLEMVRSFSFVQDGVHQSFTATMRAESALREKHAPCEDLAETIRKGIRAVLSNVVQLVADIEQRPQTAVYAANIMRYYPVDALDGERGPSVAETKQKLRFAVGTRTLKQARGVLDLDPRLSTSTQTSAEDQDPLLVGMAMTVPKIPKSENDRWRVLPGAPLAFVTASTWGADAVALVELCRDGAWEVPAKVATQIADYLASEDGRHIQSLIAHPLMAETGRQPQAILNIHVNELGLLRNTETRDRLLYLLRPSILVLLDLLVALDGHEQRGRREGLGRRTGPRADPGPVS
jgi:hypothetical protein